MDENNGDAQYIEEICRKIEEVENLRKLGRFAKLNQEFFDAAHAYLWPLRPKVADGEGGPDRA